jgi:hypothetical protein
MTSKPPPSSVRPPEPSGAGKYIAVIVLMGAGVAGLLYWKSSQTPEVVAPPPSASVPVKSAPPPVDTADIPPPPIIPDAAPEVAPKVTSTGPGSNGCEQKTCGGAITSDLRAALAFRAKTAHKCYDEALAQDSTLKGHVVISMRVGNNGTICKSSVESSELGNPSVAACMASRMGGGARLPSPQGGCLDTNVPINLLPPH